MTILRRISVLLLCVLLCRPAVGCQPITPSAPDIDSDDIPAYRGDPYVTLNDNRPLFTQRHMTVSAYEYYSPQDLLGRCGYTVACLGPELMPTEERGSIGSVKPSGWQTVKFDFVDGKYLYNRCHLIGYQLSGENANACNLITGTRYLNIEGMLPFENMVADYIRETGNHVLYRVTPVFDGGNLLASGVTMEAFSVEDNGEGICFFVYCYNVQPFVRIDYTNGKATFNKDILPAVPYDDAAYILNTNSKKVHKSACTSASSISEHNRQGYNGDLEELLRQGYEKACCCFE